MGIKCTKPSISKASVLEKRKMEFFTTVVTGLKLVVTAIGAGVGVWGVINLLEGYGNDNPGAKSQGMLLWNLLGRNLMIFANILKLMKICI